MKIKNKKGFSMLELLYTLVVLSSLFSIAIGMDFVYTKDRAADLNQEIESFESIVEDIEKSIHLNGEPIKLSSGYLTFRESNSLCLYSYVYDNSQHIISKVVDPTCTSSNLGSVRTLYKENVRNVLFTDLGNKIFKFEIKYNNKLDSVPFTYIFHVPLYNLN